MSLLLSYITMTNESFGLLFIYIFLLLYLYFSINISFVSSVDHPKTEMVL